MNEENRLLELKSVAKQRFLELPMPSWKYGLNIRLKFDLDLEKIEDIEDSAMKLFASNDIVVENMHEKVFSTLEEDNKFANLHVVNTKRILVVEAPSGKSGNAKLVTNSSKNTFDTILIIANPDSNIDFIYNNKNNNQLSSTYVEILASENSNVNFIALNNSKGHNIVTRRAVVGSNAAVNWLEANKGTGFMKSDTRSFLNAEGASTKICNLFSSVNEEQSDVFAKAIHSAPKTSSELVAKGLVNDKSKAVYQGDIWMQQNAKGAVGSQKSEVLILSKEAEADAVPKLEVDNHDVQASHSSSVGRIDSDKLFYLTSRGLTEDEAKAVMIAGFFEPLITKVTNEKVRDELRVVMR